MPNKCGPLRQRAAPMLLVMETGDKHRVRSDRHVVRGRFRRGDAALIVDLGGGDDPQRGRRE